MSYEPSAKHLFSSAGKGLNFGTRKRNSEATLDRFADLLADGVTPEAAPERMGYCAAYGRTLLQKLRKRLGSQAR